VWLREACITVLGSGHMPAASGSFGSAMSVLIYLFAWLVMRKLGWHGWAFELLIVPAGVVISCMLSLRWGDWAISYFQRKDPKPFVLDEFAGQWTSLWLLSPLAGDSAAAMVALAAGQFFWFRLFDVIKPPPANSIDRSWPGAWGVLFDDVFAGIYANIVGQVLWRLVAPASVAAWIPLIGGA